MSSRELWLIRHGQASFGAADYDCLSELGHEQSRRLGSWLKHAGHPIDAVFTGTLHRQRDTAETCLQSAGVVTSIGTLPTLDEFAHEEILARLRPDLATPAALVAEMARSDHPRRAFQRLYVEAVARWTSGEYDADYRLSWPQFRNAVLEAFQALIATDASRVLAFSSAGPIAVIVNRLLGAPPQRSFELGWPMVNTAITRITLGRTRPSLLSYNAWPHLEGADLAHLLTHR